MFQEPVRPLGRLSDDGRVMGGPDPPFRPDPPFEKKLADELAKFDVTNTPTLSDVLESLRPAFASVPNWSSTELETLVTDSFNAWEAWFVNCGDARARELEACYHPAFATVIYLYTLQEPALYVILNQRLNDVEGRLKAGKLSDELLDWIPYIRFLKVALERLPAKYVWMGSAFRGVKWVYKPDNHHLDEHYYPGKPVAFYSFKSFARCVDVPLGDEDFMGTTGLRTLFEVQAPCLAYDISLFSHYGEDEKEVLFHPLMRFEVVSVEQRIQVDVAASADKASHSHTGLHDRIVLQGKGLPRDGLSGVWFRGQCKSAQCAQSISCEAEGEKIDLLASSIECPSCHQSWGVDSVKFAGCTWRHIVTTSQPQGGFQRLTGHWGDASEVSSESFGDAVRVMLEIQFG